MWVKLFKEEEEYDEPSKEPKQRLYYHADHLGTVSFLTDDTGKKAAEYDYSPFGEVLEAHGNRAKRNFYLFTGREYLSRLGMYDYRARVYDPRAGRFAGVDPVCNQCFIGSTCINKYIYSRNNPVNFFDPTGEWSFSFDICASHIGAIASVVATFLSGGTLSAAVSTASSILASGQCTDVCVRIRGDCSIKRFKIRCSFRVSSIFGRACWRF